MHDFKQAIAKLGNEPPLTTGGRAGPPDRREISARWLSGTFLTGVTSAVLMGVALLAALDGREQLATPPEIAEVEAMARPGAGDTAKAARVVPTSAVNRARDRRRMELPTVSRVGDREVVRTMPFVELRMPLAAAYTTTRNYPAFDPLSVFAEGPEPQAQPALATSIVYDAKVESEVSLETVDFPIETAAFDETSSLSPDEVEEVVRTTGAILTDGEVQLAALHYVDPLRFGESAATATLTQSYGVRIVQENVSVAHRNDDVTAAPSFAEEILIVRNDRPTVDVLADAGFSGDDAVGMAEAIGRMMNAPALKPGTVLRLGIEAAGEEPHIVRASLYDRQTHLVTIAVDDRMQFVPADEPDKSAAVIAAFDDDRPPVRMRGELPRVYDGIYRAAYSYGMSSDMTKQLIRLVAADVDFQSRINPTDAIDVFFSQPSDDDTASAESELLYVRANFGGNERAFYRFRMADGTVDYFDADGRSARQFLLRNPLPNGKFRSGFGKRRHPILGYVKMHTGVDWAAPTGTPIIAAGSGVVKKAGWAGGYGRQTIIRHANGYESSYNHQSRFAKGVVAGARVRQGQVIGYVGSTGMSTGPHLHYELLVNGAKVDPMRVRLPNGRALKDDELVAFQAERERIDALLSTGVGGSLRLASAAR
ncbi:M23 family metallopeptidase [Aquibium sp. ELW1220]|jgi:murein DD-endopeptidase MepM/ murein hydrolase activator NlpD|uniref:M23 family metallopeptidase n=1 Tax=Aquibium sp. ELW1220 TaxID=2976766 RepID=UPI0025B06B4D|nr:M23 family metallopeptidase [Aquibium sp. ELW1220]MDN2582459.1 M23 family metallopeptidase [Aquibium sp. ELW1220]